MGVAIDLDAAVVLPLVGISHLGRELRQLVQGFRLGIVAHPGKRLDVIVQRQQNIFYQPLNAGLCFRWKNLFNIFLAQRLAQIGVGRFHATLPARLHLLGPGQILAIKRKIFVDEGSRKIWRGRPQHVPFQIRLPVG